MFIRNDLEEEIKNQFKVEKFSYRGMGKNIFNDCDAFIFDTNKGTIAVEISLFEIYYIYEIEETPENSENSYTMKPKTDCWFAFGEQTYLKTNEIVTSFQGKAFDFTEELVLLALEQGGNWNVY